MTQPIEPKATVKKVDCALGSGIDLYENGIPTLICNCPITEETNQTLAALWEVAIPALRHIWALGCGEGKKDNVGKWKPCYLSDLDKDDWCEQCIAHEALKKMGVE